MGEYVMWLAIFAIAIICTHGGQLIPITYVGEWIGANDQTKGLVTKGNTTYIVSDGISDWEIPFKTGCKAEYVVIDIE